MPVQNKKSGLAAKLGSKGAKAVEETKNNETILPKGGGVPAGIEGGIAQLTDCRFGEYENGDNAGQPYFYAAGVIIEPEFITGPNGEKIPVAGLQTRMTEPLFDTPSRTRKTLREHIDHVLNEFRKLGMDTSELTLDDLEGAAESLKEAAPFFRLRTWKGQKQTTGPYAGQEPRVNEVWQGSSGLENYSKPDGSGAVNDNSGGDSPDDEVEDAPAPKPKPSTSKPSGAKPGGVKPKPGAKPAPEPEPEPEQEAEGEQEFDPDNLEALGTAADEGDEEAQAALTAQAELFNVSDKQIQKASDWAEVANLIKEAHEAQTAGEGGEGGDDEPPAEEEEEAPAEEEWEPQKEEVYKFKAKVKDPKTKKEVMKTIEVEVTAVNKAKKTVALKSVDDGKTTYKDVAWDKLIGDEG